MDTSSDLRYGRSCVFKLHIHLVFVTRYRRDIFSPEHYVSMGEVFAKVCEDFGAELMETDGEKDHVHLLVNYPPTVSVSKLVNSLKGVSSRLLRKKHPEIERHYWKGGLWSPSYFAASCGGAPISIIRQYIENQRT